MVSFSTFDRLNFYLIRPWILFQIIKQAHAQGTGRHSKEDVEKIGRGHLQALSDFLGDKDVSTKTLFSKALFSLWKKVDCTCSSKLF